MDITVKQGLIAATAIACVVLIVMCIAIKKRRVTLIAVLLSLCAVLGAMLNGAFRMDLKERQCEKYIGERSVRMVVTSDIFVSEGTSMYAVDIRSISDEATDVKAVLVCAFETQLSVGDSLIGSAHIENVSTPTLGMNVTQIYDRPDVYVSCTVYEPENLLLDRFEADEAYIFKEYGATVAVSRLKDALKGRIAELLGEDFGALSNGILLGDKSDIPTDVLRDFRRAGVSHLFAVSGLHIVILLGVIELVLKKLYVHKYARIGIVSFFGLVLLAFTGFSMSAMRAVFMLWIVYLNFMLSEDSDAPTTLFASVTLIIAVFPYSVFELGMWMSFLATLGLVTVFSVFEGYVPKSKNKNIVFRVVLSIGRWILLSIVMTAVCNVFLLPIMCWIFGELSVMGFASNVVLSPLSAVFMILTLFSLVLGGIPFVGEVVADATANLGNAMISFARLVSSWSWATVSLKYFFAGVLVVGACLCVSVMLVISMKRKWLIAVPIVSFAVLFTSCVTAFNVYDPQRVTYYGDGTREIISVSSADTLCIVDMSGGSYLGFSRAISDALEYGATSVDSIVLTRITSTHLSSLEYILGSSVVRKIYLPTPKDDITLERAVKLTRIAEEYGTSAYLYDDTQIFDVDGIAICVLTSQNGEKQAATVVVKGEKNTFGYVDALICGSPAEQTANKLLAECQTVIVGNRAIPEKPYEYSISKDTALIYSSEDIKKSSEIYGVDNVYCNTQKAIKLSFRLK